MTILLILIGYLVLGLVFLGVYETVTHRIRSKFDSVALDNQIQTLGIAQMPVSLRTVKILTFLGLWTQWPLLIPYLVSYRKGDKNAAK